MIQTGNGPNALNKPISKLSGGKWKKTTCTSQGISTIHLEFHRTCYLSSAVALDVWPLGLIDALGSTAASSHGWVPAIGWKSIMVLSLCNGCREHPAEDFLLDRHEPC